jgi:hypothetical protein
VGVLSKIVNHRESLRAIALASLSLVPLMLTSNIEYEYTLMQLWLLVASIPFIKKPHFKDVVSFLLPSVVLSLIWGCNSLGYLMWCSILILPSAMWAYLLSRCFTNSLHYFMAVSFWAMLCLLSVWTMPQVRLFTMLFGFLHGPIYDHSLYVSEPLLYLVVFQIILGILVSLYFSRLAFLAASVLVLVAMQQVDQTALGLETLKAHFPIREVRRGVTIYAQRDNPNIQRLIKETEFHYAELSDILETEVAVSVFIYKSEKDKKILFGGGESDVTDVFNRSIHISESGFMHPTLRHELVHAIFASFSWLGFHPNMAITEGVAVAFAPEQRQIDLHVAAGGILEQGKIKNIDRLFSPLFWLEGGARSYTVAGSFIRFVLDTEGVDETKRVFTRFWFDKQQYDIFKRWQVWVNEKYTQSRSTQAVDHVFKMGGILERRCPHTLADIRLKSFWCPRNLTSDHFIDDPLAQLRKADIAKINIDEITGDDLRSKVFREDMRAIKEGRVESDPTQELWPLGLRRHVRVRDALLAEGGHEAWLEYMAGRQAIPSLKLNPKDSFVVSYLKLRRVPEAVDASTLKQLIEKTRCEFYCNIWGLDLLQYAMRMQQADAVRMVLDRYSDSFETEYEILAKRLAKSL